MMMLLLVVVVLLLFLLLSVAVCARNVIVRAHTQEP